MSADMHKNELDRRYFILGSTAMAAFAALVSPSSAQTPTPTAEELIKAITKDVKPADGKVALDLPEIAENGNTVPFSFTVESPMTAADHVKAVHVIAPGNPRAEIGSYYFSPQSGKASASSRMRLAKTQDIIAIAEMSDGKLFMTKRAVKVTIGGCGG